MKKRDIIIVMAALVFGLIYNAIKSGDFAIRFHRGVPTVSWQLKDKSYPNDFAGEAIRFDRLDEIRIRNIAGDIEVETASLNPGDTGSPGILIQPVIRVYHRNKKKAAALSKKIDILSRVRGENGDSDGQPAQMEKKKLNIEVKSSENFSFQRVRVNFKLVIPAAVALDLRTRYGDMEIDGRGAGISLDGKHGDISVKNVDSPVRIDHKNGRLVLTDVQDRVHLSARNSTVRINQISGLLLDCYLCDVEISGVENKVHIDSAAYSSISMKNGNEFLAVGRHTKFKLENIDGSVGIKNSHKLITLSKIRGNIHLSANNCKINLVEITAGDVVIKNDHKYINIDGISADSLDILSSGGNLDIAVLQIKERLNIKNRNSNVTLKYPSSLRPVFNLEARYGSITGPAPGELSILKERERDMVIPGRADGKPEITIRATYGDIRLETVTPKNI